MNLNWVDGVIIVILAYYTFQGWSAGFTDLVLSFITFLISLFLSIKFHAVVGDFLSHKFGISPTWSEVLGYVLVAFIAQGILSELVQLIIVKLPPKLILSKTNKWLGGVASLFNGLVIIAFFLLVALALPLGGTIKTDIQQSKIGNVLITVVQKYGGPVNPTIQEAGQQALKFITIEPDSKESIPLSISPTESELKIDAPDEQKMVDLVNTERAKVGAGKLTIDATLTTVARAHSKDMFLRRYFSHITLASPAGGPGDRLEKAGVDFTLAGENIAYAPDLNSAHIGLMNSPGHRANILNPSFRRVGIGIISTDVWGMMVTQDFAN
jgi:uncharacterized protein YkwD